MGLALSWLLSLPFAWLAFATVPAAERLSRSHLVAIPTLHTFLLQVGGSALELVVVLAWLWPGRARWWLARLWLAALGLLLYFLATPPLGLTALNLVHRRWLAAVVFLLLLSAVAVSLRRGFARPAVR